MSLLIFLPNVLIIQSLMLPLFYLIFGLILGSFVNVLIYRLPRGQGVMWGRSSCPNCHHILSWLDLIPIFSFIFLGARCRYCRKKISWRYPLVELLSGLIVLGVLLEGTASSWLELAFKVFWLEVFLALAVTDFLFLILPDKISLAALIGWAILGFLQKAGVAGGESVFSRGHLLAGLLFFGILLLVWLFSGGQWLGLGDVKLMGWVGLVFGPIGASVILYEAFILGGIMGLALYIFTKANLKTKLPLGTFISIMGIIYVLTGTSILNALNFYFIFR